jgi:hypothetical protein
MRLKIIQLNFVLRFNNLTIHVGRCLPNVHNTVYVANKFKRKGYLKWRGMELNAKV